MGETNSNSPFKFKLGAQTNVGCVRTNNEDNFVVSTDLAAGEWLLPRDCHTLFTLGDKGAMLVVADGMGGLDAGEIASRIAVDTVKEFFSADKITDEIAKDDSAIRKYMHEAVVAADNAIKKRSKEEEGVKSMGTTLVAAWLFEGFANIVWCGDSRAYLFNPVSGLAQVTKDHSYVQELVSRGEISPEMAKNHPKKNYITRAMGAEDTVKVDISIKPYNGETLVLCSDGLTNFVEDDEIRTYIKNKSNLQKSAEELVALANERGGGDNITIVALEREKCDNEQ